MTACLSFHLSKGCTYSAFEEVEFSIERKGCSVSMKFVVANVFVADIQTVFTRACREKPVHNPNTILDHLIKLSLASPL